MNIVMKIAYASFEFVIINIIAIPFAVVSPVTWLWYMLCIGLAFVLRIGMEHKKHRITWPSLMYQSICTVSWCFFMVLVWYTYLNYARGFEVYLFLNSLFAAFMVGQLESIGKQSIKDYLRAKLGKFLAVERKEDQP